MKIECYYYTEEKAARTKRMERMQQGYSDEKTLEVEMISDVVFQKQERFREFIPEAMEVAERLRANLLIDIDPEGMSGCLAFVGEELIFEDTEGDFLRRLMKSSNEFEAKVSVDTGQDGPTDLDGLPQIEFWFDFHEETELR